MEYNVLYRSYALMIKKELSFSHKYLEFFELCCVFGLQVFYFSPVYSGEVSHLPLVVVVQVCEYE